MQLSIMAVRELQFGNIPVISTIVVLTMTVMFHQCEIFAAWPVMLIDQCFMSPQLQIHTFLFKR